MPGTRTITIESPPKNHLSVQIEETLVDKFVQAATNKGGSWRSRKRKETFQRALESAVAVALTKFLEGLNQPDSQT